jgi:hypothetical protein
MAAAEVVARKLYWNRDSGVRYYASGPSFIDVWFRKGEGYRYDQSKPGASHVKEMKRLAEAGSGLATYISRHVRDNYARKL